MISLSRKWQTLSKILPVNGKISLCHLATMYLKPKLIVLVWQHDPQELFGIIGGKLYLVVAYRNFNNLSLNYFECKMDSHTISAAWGEDLM